MTDEERKEKDRARKAKYYVENKDIIKAARAKYYVENKDIIKAARAKYYTSEEGKEKRRTADVTYYAANKEKIKARKAAWRAANPEKAKAFVAAYRAANPEKLKARNAAYRAANLKKVRTREAAHQRQRRAKDPVFAMSGRLRTRLNIAFKDNGFKKNSCTEKMLGCTFKQFSKHIERQFTEGMSWDNRGEWHLDHIVPLYCATTIEGLEKLSHYKNIRPLWSADNRAKSKNLVLS